MTDTAQPTDSLDGGNGTPDSVAVSTVVPQPIERIWTTLITPSGIEALLGTGATLGGKGEPWHSTDGTHGVVRSYHPMQQVRVSWHADEHAPSTFVDLQLSPVADGTRLDLRHEHIDAANSDALTQRWKDALNRVAAAS